MRTETAQRIVVLGREGSARDQLIGALADLGVEPVWVGRPGQNDPDSLLLLNPNRIVVSLESAIEFELEPYGEILGLPSISVVYDDAEFSKGLDGGELKRWSRHLAAKLLDLSLLPPVPNNQTEAVPENAAEPQIPSADFLNTAVVIDSFSASEPKAIPEWLNDGDYEELEIEQHEFEKALEQLNQSLSEDYSPDTDLVRSLEKSVPLSEDENGLWFESRSEALPIKTRQDMKSDLDDNDSFSESDEAVEGTAILSGDEELRSFLAETAAAILHPEVAPEVRPQSGNIDFKLDFAAKDMALVDFAQSHSVVASEFDLSKYAFVDNDKEPDNARADKHELPRPLVRHEPKVHSGGNSGLFLVVSGIGSPGALRSLLAEISEDFKGIVALSHQIDPTKLPAFRGQLQKVSKLPLEAIVDNEYVKSGHIYLLPPNCTLFKTPLGYQCIRGGLGKLIDHIDHNLKILILSGADVSLSQSLIKASAASHNVCVQNPDDCYEFDLARQLFDVGAPVLDRNILDHWFN